MPVFSSKMTLFGKAGLYTIIGMVSGCGVEAAGDEQLASTTNSTGMIRSQRYCIQCIAVLLCWKKRSIYALLLILHAEAEMMLNGALICLQLISVD